MSRYNESRTDSKEIQFFYSIPSIITSFKKYIPVQNYTWSRARFFNTADILYSTYIILYTMLYHV